VGGCLAVKVFRFIAPDNIICEKVRVFYPVLTSKESVVTGQVPYGPQKINEHPIWLNCIGCFNYKFAITPKTLAWGFI